MQKKKASKGEKELDCAFVFCLASAMRSADSLSDARLREKVRAFICPSPKIRFV